MGEEGAADASVTEVPEARAPRSCPYFCHRGNVAGGRALHAQFAPPGFTLLSPCVTRLGTHAAVPAAGRPLP
eukprot:7621031-Alexandrium_andersonii.AAC.1